MEVGKISFDSDSDSTTPDPPESDGRAIQDPVAEFPPQSIPNAEVVPPGLGSPTASNVYGGEAAPENRATNGTAVAALVCGILGVTACPLVLSVVALVLGYNARSDLRQPSSREQGDGLATAGIVMGWIGVGISVVIALLFAGLFVVFGIVGASLSA